MSSVLVLGGVGFIGRNFVTYLVENDLASGIRVVDKVLPATAYLTKRQAAAFSKVEFKQANLVNPASISKAFEKEDGSSFDYVVNLAAETKYSQTEDVYEEKVFTLSVNCAKEAVKRNVKIFIQMSTGQVYDAGKKSSAEDSNTKPWTLIAKAQLRSEEELRKMVGLNVIFVRPAVVYGPSDVSGITPRLVVGAVYKHLGETMKLLWSKDLRINTVHVHDVARAIWHLIQSGHVGQVYNLCDKGDTDQETINAIIRKLFKVETGFQGTIISNFAKLNLQSVTEDVNEKHLQPWSEMCKKAGIENTPLTPYLDQELLYNNSLRLDGSKIETTGFVYEHPKVTEELLKEVLDEFVVIKAFPPGLY